MPSDEGSTLFCAALHKYVIIQSDNTIALLNIGKTQRDFMPIAVITQYEYKFTVK